MTTYRKAALAAGLIAAILVAGTGCSGGGAGSAAAGGTGLEKSSIDIGLTGVGAISNVPLYLADALGYFADEGLTVNLSALQGGTTSLQALITDTVDATTGEFNATINVQQEGKYIESLEVFSTAPTYALVTTKDHFDATPADLQDMTIGVVSLGGSTEQLIRYVFTQNGLDPDDAHLVAVGAGSQQTAAVKSGELDALIATEPTLTTTLNDGQTKLLVDFRDPKAIDEMFGGPAPFWSLMVSDTFTHDNPRTAQALVNATTKALDFIHSHSASEIADELPADVFFPGGDRDLFEDILEPALQSFSTDGLMPEGGVQRMADYLQIARPDEDYSDVDIDRTYDDSFARAAH